MTETKSGISYYHDFNKLKQFLKSCNPLTVYTCEDEKYACEQFIGSFNKAFEHDKTTGKLDKCSTEEYKKLACALFKNDANLLKCVYTKGKFADPYAAIATTQCGPHPCIFQNMVPEPPKLDSIGRASSYSELLLRAAARDVNFENYEHDPTINAAVHILNGDLKNVSKYVYFDHCKNKIDTDNIFRGTFKGERKGEFLSRFLTIDIPSHGSCLTTIQDYNFPDATDDNNFMKTLNDAICAQDGDFSGTIQKTLPPRKINTLRDLGDFVHNDPPGLIYMNAAKILNGSVPPNPYFKSPDNSGAFVVSGGFADVASTLGETVRIALSTAWYYKWKIHRTLRPEAYGILFTQERNEIPLGRNKCFVLPKNIRKTNDLLNQSVQLLKDVRITNFGSTVEPIDEGLLPQQYPEGSPSHPSYPAGHAVAS